MATRLIVSIAAICVIYQSFIMTYELKGGIYPAINQHDWLYEQRLASLEKRIDLLSFILEQNVKGDTVIPHEYKGSEDCEIYTDPDNNWPMRRITVCEGIKAFK